MADEGADRQVSGLYTNMLVGSLRQQLSDEGVRDVLRAADELRTIEELMDFSSWSSHPELRRLLEAAAQVSGPWPDSDDSDDFVTSPEMAETIQTFGSPGAVLALNVGSNPMLRSRLYETKEIAPNKWTIREWFVDGVDPYPEFCAFVANQYALIPRYFGLPPGIVEETECQCRGDSACLFSISWDTTDLSAAETGYYKVRSELLESRLHQLEAMVTDLAANDRYEDVLQGVVRSSLSAVGAGGALLAIEARNGHPRKLYFEGLSKADAEPLATALLAESGGRPDITSVKVASGRATYGILACDQLGGIFASQSLPTLQTYGRLAAATLDAAEAFDDARHQANTAEVLLGLASALAEIVSVEEMAAKLAHAVPALIDCDRVAIFLEESVGDGTESEFRIAASLGYSALQLQILSSRSFSRAEYPDRTEERGIERSLVSTVGNVASISVDITLTGQKIGWISASVTSDPDRLAVTPRLTTRLRGLAAQASIAFSNANLVDQIRFKALHDPLTGLPNRSLLLDRIEQMVARARRSAIQVGVLFIDLDGFKEVNDTLGHGAGDQLLKAVGDRLCVTMRGSDSVGRLGGDEFVVLVDGSTMDVGPELVADRLLDVLRDPFEIEDGGSRPVRITASIGIALGLRDSAGELLRDADTALYEAKSAGKNCFISFLPEMHTTVQNHLLLQMDLRDALRLDQYFLVYQPILNLASGVTTGVEALLRWRHPERGVVMPGDFIPLLESTNLIIDVGLWVLEQACRQGAQWRSEGFALDVSVNVSTRQLESVQFVGYLEQVLRSSKLEPGALIIEITETSMMRDVDAVIPRLQQLKALGIRIAIDDFGTGYSSLASLQRFPIDTIKIDQSFIARMGDSPEATAMIRTLVQLGRTLGLETLAEGIEGPDQCQTLEEERCDSGQGYLFARPMEADAVGTFLAKRALGQSIPDVAFMMSGEEDLGRRPSTIE